MRKTRCLVLDIETSPLLVYTWDLKEQFIKPNQIYKDWYILAWGAKWLGEKQVFYQDTYKQKDDKKILKLLWKLLDEADIVVTQNGKNFDSKKINARFILNKMDPPSSYRHLDTYQIAKHAAGFTSHSLEYLSRNLCAEHKTTHGKYPGLSLWIECLKNNKDAWKEMKDYNIQDVTSTEELYYKIRAWAPGNAPKVFDLTDASYQCGTCGHIGPMREGKPKKAKRYYYKQHSCPKCGAWQTGIKITEPRSCK